MRRERDDRGVASVEFALALFLLVPMVVGLIDLGGYLKAQSRVTNAANAGAAFAQNHPGSVDAGCTGGSITDSARAEDSSALAAAVIDVYNTTSSIPPTAPSITGCSTTTATKVRVVCTVSYSLPIKLFWKSPIKMVGYRDVVVQ